MSLEHNKKSTALGTCRAAGTIVGFTYGCQGALLVVSPKDAMRTKNQRLSSTGTMSLWHWCALCTFEKACSMTNFSASWLAHFVLWQILSWSLQKLNQSQCGATGKRNALSFDNSYVPCSNHMMIPGYDISTEKLTSFPKWLTSNNVLRSSKEILVCLKLQNFSNFSSGWILVDKIAVTGM